MDRFRLEDLVRSLLVERFPAIDINRIAVEADEDSDGDRILRITVVMASEPEALDRSELLAFTNRLRLKLVDERFDGFPVLSFVTVKEVGKLKLESA